MKRLLLVLASMATVASTIAQDVLVKRDGEEIQCRILEVSTNKVKYKQWKNQDGPTFVEKKSDILMLKYENGTKEVMTYTSPVGAAQIEEPTVAETPVDSAALADTMPISNDFLEYARKEKSGLLMWGRSLTELQAHTILGKDWTDFTRAHKNERVGRGLIFVGGALIVGGGLWTAQHIWAAKDYNDKKSAYENHVVDANAKYTAKANTLKTAIVSAEEKLSGAETARNKAKVAYDNAKEDLGIAEKKFEEVKKTYVEGSTQYTSALNDYKNAESKYTEADGNYNKAKTSYDHADANVVKATGEYQDFVDNRDEIYNASYYDATYKTKMTNAENYKKFTLAPMIGCYASGAALLIWGIVKEKRAHKKINEIVNRLNAEDAYPGELPESRRKPEFDMEGRENGLAFLLRF